jgi:hypothetical protein
VRGKSLTCRPGTAYPEVFDLNSKVTPQPAMFSYCQALTPFQGVESLPRDPGVARETRLPPATISHGYAVNLGNSSAKALTGAGFSRLYIWKQKMKPREATGVN